MWYFVLSILLTIGGQPSPITIDVGGFQTKELCEEIRAKVSVHSSLAHSSVICRRRG